MLLIKERGSNMVRNSVFDRHLLPVGRQMAIKNYFSRNFDIPSSIEITFSISPFFCVFWLFLRLCLPQWFKVHGKEVHLWINFQSHWFQ